MRRPGSRVAFVLALSAVGVALTGCTWIRVHDEARLGTAKEAVELTAELRKGDLAPFDVMEANIEKVRAAEAGVAAHEHEVALNTLFTALPEYTAEDVAIELGDAYETHDQVRSFLNSQASAAARRVRNAVARETEIANLLNPERLPSTDEATPESILRALDERLARTNKALRWLLIAKEKLESGDAAGRLGLADAEKQEMRAFAAGVTARAGAASRAVKAASEAVEDVKGDEQVKRSRQLLLDAGQELLAAERTRLVEMRRHLGVVHDLQTDFAERDEYYLDSLLIPALGRVDVALALELFGRRGQQLEPEEVQFLEDRFENDWGEDPTIVEFANAKLGLDDDEEKADAMKFFASFGEILLVEEPLDVAARAELSAELHRHSIRISEINARQRMDLLHQIAAGLEIYYQGGIRPEELARLIFVGAQTAALVEIAGDG